MTFVVGVERWLSYKLHDMYLYKTDNFFHINHYLFKVSLKGGSLTQVLLYTYFQKAFSNALEIKRSHRDSNQVNKVDGLTFTFSEAKKDLTTSHL